MNNIAGIQVIGRSHHHNGQHICTTPTLISKTGKLFHHLKGTHKALFVNLTNWFWLPTEGFYGVFSIRNHDQALADFYDFTTFNEKLTSYVAYLGGN